MVMQASLNQVVGGAREVTFNAGAQIAPGADIISIYNEVQGANVYRDKEVWDSLTRLFDWARENATLLVAGSIRYVYVLGADGGPSAPKGKILTTTVLGTATGGGNIALGFGVNTPYGSTARVNARLREIRQAMWNSERIYG